MIFHLHRNRFIRIFAHGILCLFFYLSAHVLPVYAIGISPARVNLSILKPGDVLEGSVLLLRDHVHDATGDLPMTMTVRGSGSNVVSGSPSFTFPAASEEFPYTFSIKPTTALQGSYTVQLDFLMKKSDVPSVSSGATVVSGATALLSFTVLNAVQMSPNASGATVVDFATPQVFIANATQPVTIDIPKNIPHPTIDVSSFISEGRGTIPKISIIANNAGNLHVDIPASTTVVSTNPNWNGVIDVPTPTTITLPAVSGETKTVSFAIEVGYEEGDLRFDKAVRLLLPDQGNKRAGYKRFGEAFQEITDICVGDSQSAGDLMPAGAECAMTVGSDLVIWTKHFTTFATYTQKASGEVSNTSSAPVVTSWGGGTSTDSVPVVLPSTIPVFVAEPPIVEPPDSPKQILLKKTLAPTVVFSQPDKKKRKQVVVKEKGEPPSTIIIDETMEGPMVKSDTHTTSYRYYHSKDVHLEFTPSFFGISFEKYFYTITESPQVFVSQLQSVATNAPITVSLPDGEFYVHVSGLRGNKLSLPRSRKILIDTTPPVLSRMHIETSSHVFGGSTSVLWMDVHDQTAGLAYNKLITPYGTEVFVTDKIPLKHLHIGDQTYEIQMVDITGNVNKQNVTIHVDPETEWETMKRLGKVFMEWMTRKH